MEFLKGRTLDAIVREQGPFSAREAIVIAVDICGAVAAIHGAGLIHRDLKAQNVMREPGGRLVVMDVGASVTIDIDDDDAASTSLAGTPLYMAPELFDRARPSVTSDVYAMGVMLYRLVTAEFRFLVGRHDPDWLGSVAWGPREQDSVSRGSVSWIHA